MVLELIKYALLIAAYGLVTGLITQELAKALVRPDRPRIFRRVRSRDDAVRVAFKIAVWWPVLLPLLGAVGIVLTAGRALQAKVRNSLPMPQEELDALEREVLAEGAKDEAAGQGYRSKDAMREYFMAQAERRVHERARELEQVTVCQRCLCPVVRISAYRFIHCPELGAPPPCSTEHPTETTITRETWRKAVAAKHPVTDSRGRPWWQTPEGSPEREEVRRRTALALGAECGHSMAASCDHCDPVKAQERDEIKRNLGKVLMYHPDTKATIWVAPSAAPIHERSGWQISGGPFEPEDLASLEISDEVAERFRGHMLRNEPDRLTILSPGMEIQRVVRSAAEGLRDEVRRQVPKDEPVTVRRLHRELHGGPFETCPKCHGPALPGYEPYQI